MQDEQEAITLRLSHEQLERLTQVAKRQGGILGASHIKRSVFTQLEANEQVK